MKKILFLGLALFLLGPAFAAVKLPAVLGSNMVLQRECNANLWGEASPSKKVTVVTSWDGRKYTTTADASGAWKLAVATPEAGGPYTIRISDGKEGVTLDNVMIGEVWICSGQSNMQMTMTGNYGEPTDGSAEALIEAGKYRDLIRLFAVDRVPSAEPRTDCNGAWQEASSASAAGFSAAAYYFGRNLADALDIPIGLIEADWGGTRIEAWMTVAAAQEIEPDMLANDPNHGESNKAARLFNGMIRPIVNYTARGFIWYQGESNIITGNYLLYARYMDKLVSLWRAEWGDPDMPFYYVQLAPHRYEGTDGISLPLIIEQQLIASDRIPHTGMIGTTDIGHDLCIHPSQKDIVGRRLALLALTDTYGLQGLVSHGPRYESVRFEDGKAYVSFKTDATLGPNYTGRIQGFEIAGPDKVFIPARAEYVPGKTEVVVSSELVAEPVAVRYAFRNVPKAATLTNTGGLPAFPFRTDDWNDVK